MTGFDGVDLICFSHLRWNFVYQRPQHLMSRIAETHRVFFMEEPIYDDGVRFEIQEQSRNVWVIVPHLTPGMSEEDVLNQQRDFLSRMLVTMNIVKYATWYYTPMALPMSEHLKPVVTVYDCMDELSAFKFAPPVLVALEKRLMKKADVVFTGGYSLFEAKKINMPISILFPAALILTTFQKREKLWKSQRISRRFRIRDLVSMG